MPKITTVEASGSLPISTTISSLIIPLVTIHSACLICIVNPISIPSIISLWSISISTPVVVSVSESSLASLANSGPTRIL
ncbi:hypothetical protein HanRHA438_Chr12g0572281 [Helianthus annuus]|nr:hypothetical protein HanRHA438_Chr12g0572281 [Helianthus annuus]